MSDKERTPPELYLRPREERHKLIAKVESVQGVNIEAREMEIGYASDWVVEKMGGMTLEQANMVKDAVKRILRVTPAVESGWQAVEIVANKGPTLEFEGREVIGYSTQNEKNPKPRWTELTLWETRAGAWIVESVGCSDNDREVDIIDAQVFLPLSAQADAQSRQLAVMDWLGWSYPARAIAKRLGWDLTLRVE